jgi:hypothetical protein
MKHLAILTALVTLTVAPPALAQVSLAQASLVPLRTTTPLGMGPGAPVAPAGIPLGATQLSTAGISPALPGIVPQGAITGNNTICSGTMSTAGIASPTPLFDASAGTVSGTCATTGAGASPNPAASASSPTGIGSVAAVGRIGIPMGATELDPGGLSLPSPATPPTSATPMAMVPATPLMISPLAAATSSSAAAMSSSSPVVSACVGVPGNINSTGSSAAGAAGVC